MDQVTNRRRKTGLIACNRMKSAGGYTLFTPLTGGGVVYLVDEQGEVVHTWKRDTRPGRHAVLLPNGNLGYNGSNPDSEILYPLWNLWHGGLFQEVSPDGNVIWEHRDLAHHHDAVWLPNGNLLYATAERLPDAYRGSIQGALGTQKEGTPIVADVIKEVNRNGHVVWQWRSWEHLSPKDFPFEPVMPHEHWPYVNGLAKTRSGLVLMSLRVTSGIIAVNPLDGKIVWRVGRNITAQQHAPVELENGNILAFDNGNYRPLQSTPFSRVVEFNPAGEMAWEYTDPVPPSFFSPYMGNAQRLPGGNTLVNEAAHGRLFEVTPRHEIVWEYVIPYFNRYPPEVEKVYNTSGYHNSTFKAFRYQKNEIPWL
ncbi:MAG: aryl-sulfate sulfotransferase [Burkholderiaceae bacterium]|nr:aryl-sulfate sulfotransferase [Burkholderiaceae bacterium]